MLEIAPSVSGHLFVDRDVSRMLNAGAKILP